MPFHITLCETGLFGSRTPWIFQIFDIPKNSISSVLPLSIQTKFLITVIILSSLSFKVTGMSIYHPNESVICLELPFIAKLDGLSAFYLSVLIARSFIPLNSLLEFKKDLKIVKSFILAFRYYKDNNHSSDSFDSSSWAFLDKHIFHIGGESLDNSWSYVSGWLDSRGEIVLVSLANLSFTCFFFPVHNTTHYLLCHNHLPHYLNLEVCIGTA